MKEFIPLNRRFAVILAFVSWWLLSSIGVFLVIHYNDWLFFGLHGHDATTIEQIGGFYLALTGVQLMAVYAVSLIICISNFPHPVRTTFWTVSLFYLVKSAITAIRWPWGSQNDLDQAVPILAYLISTLLLIGFSVFITWLMTSLMPKLKGVFRKHCSH